MAKVFQLLERENMSFWSSKSFDPNVVDGYWHVTDAIENRTLCGYQTDGEDGVVPSESVEGFVTCPQCLAIIRYVKNIRRWEQRPRRSRAGGGDKPLGETQ